jgi:hypothetical protein
LKKPYFGSNATEPVKELLTDFQDNQNFKEQRDLFDSNF